MSYDFTIEQRNLDRVQDIRFSTERPRPRGRGLARVLIGDAAKQLDRSGRLQSELALVVESVAALIDLLYRADESKPANFEQSTGMILIPVPWSNRGAMKWGLRQWEGRLLRKVMFSRLANRDRSLVPLFDYNEFSCRWYIDVDSYRTYAAAMDWLKAEQPTIDEWRTIRSRC